MHAVGIISIHAKCIKKIECDDVYNAMLLSPEISRIAIYKMHVNQLKQATRSVNLSSREHFELA